MTNGGYFGFQGHHTLLKSFVMESAMMFSGQVKGRLVHPNMAYSRSPLHIDAILDFCSFCFYIKLAKIRKDQKVTCGFKFRCC